MYGDEYLAELDYIEVVERFKEGYESEVIEPDVRKGNGHEHEGEDADDCQDEQDELDESQVYKTCLKFSMIKREKIQL